MNFSQSKACIDNKLTAIVVSGDAFLISEFVKFVAAHLAIVDSDITVFDSESFNAKVIIQQCEQLSFFQSKRLVVIKNINTCSDGDIKLFNQYLSSPNPSCVVLFVDSYQNKVFKDIKAEKMELFANENDINQFINQFLKQVNKTMAQPAKNLLISYTSKNILQIQTEIKKISAYVGDREEITEQDIMLNIVPTEEIIVFDLTTALSKKNQKKAMELTAKLISTPDQNSKILSLISGNFRRMFYASISKKTNSELALIFNVKEFAISKAKEQANNFTQRKLKQVCEIINDVEFFYKSGQMTQENAMYYLVGKILNI